MSAPLLRTARLLDLVPYLNTHQGIALKELAAHFDVTPAQMSADLTTLWMCGLPGYTPLELMDLEFESGYVTIRNATTLAKPRTITFQEGIALLLGLDSIATTLPGDRPDLIDAIESLRQRLTKLLGVPVKVSVVPIASPEVTNAIAKALTSNGGLLIKYHSLYKDEVSERTVIPVDLYQSNGHQYLKAFCLASRDYRQFRIDRIASAKNSTVSADVSEQKMDPEKISYTITVQKSSRDVAERFAIADLPVGQSLELSSFSRQWIERSVMAAGGTVVLNSPSDIREAVLNKAQLMLNRYKDA
jgi:proteasome accessory factor C